MRLAWAAHGRGVQDRIRGTVAGLVLIAGGALLGLIVGRWWALAAPLAVGVWIAFETEVEAVPPWFLGGMYALGGAVGVAVGIVLRAFLTRRV